MRPVTTNAPLHLRNAETVARVLVTTGKGQEYAKVLGDGALDELLGAAPHESFVRSLLHPQVRELAGGNGSKLQQLGWTVTSQPGPTLVAGRPGLERIAESPIHQLADGREVRQRIFVDQFVEGGPTSDINLSTDYLLAGETVTIHSASGRYDQGRLAPQTVRESIGGAILLELTEPAATDSRLDLKDYFYEAYPSAARESGYID